MIIEEQDFRMTQISENSPFWDLELLKTIRPKGKEARQEMTNAGYGMTLPSCIRAITAFRVHNNHPDDSVTLKQYLSEYISELQKLDKSLGYVEPREDQ